MIRRFACAFLRLAEGLYLRAHGWERVGRHWFPPEGFSQRGAYSRGLAVWRTRAALTDGNLP